MTRVRPGGVSRVPGVTPLEDNHWAPFSALIGGRFLIEGLDLRHEVPSFLFTFSDL
jgi:hypothetical protein